MIPISAGSDQRGAFSGGRTGAAGGGDSAAGPGEAGFGSALSGAWGRGSVADVTTAPCGDGMSVHCGMPGSGL